MRRVGTTVCLGAALALPVGQAATEARLYAFTDRADGGGPRGGVVSDSRGNLYGSTSAGGAGGCGTIYALSPPSASSPAGTFTVLYSLASATDGCGPDTTLTRGPDGTLYGTTPTGGASGDGTVFSLSPPLPGQSTWNFHMLYSFTQYAEPSGALLLTASGALFGVTINGGTLNVGVVYRLAPPPSGGTSWGFHAIYQFQAGTDGSGPFAGVVTDASGALYGTAVFGGAAGAGTFYKLTPPAGGQTSWTETTLYPFAGGADGTIPEAELVQDSAGNFYGTMSGVFGMGTATAFELSPPAPGQTAWSYRVLFTFGSSTGSPQGYAPQAPLLPDGNGGFYGTTFTGGTSFGGVVFQISPPPGGQIPWTETVLHSFGQTATDGSYPGFGKLLLDKASLIGTTEAGGRNSGTVYKVHP